MGTMRIMGMREGDETLTWSKDDEESVSKARQAFDDARAKGAAAFKVVTETVKKRGQEIKEFDPSLEEIIIAAPMAGGSR